MPKIKIEEGYFDDHLKGQLLDQYTERELFTATLMGLQGVGLDIKNRVSALYERLAKVVSELHLDARVNGQSAVDLNVLQERVQATIDDVYSTQDQPESN